MALPLNNTAEGGSAATTVTTANSGGASGNAFDNVSIGASATLTFDSAQEAHGALSYLIVQPASAVTSYVEWGAALGGAQATLYGRVYVYQSAFGGATDIRLVRFLSGATVAAGLGITTAGKIRALGGAGGNTGQAPSSTLTMSANTWYRIDFKYVFDTAAGTVDLRIFTGANLDGTTPDESIAYTAVNTGGVTSADTVRFGCAAGGVPSASTWFDDLNLNATDYPGPAVAAAAPGMTQTFNPIPFMGGR